MKKFVEFVEFNQLRHTFTVRLPPLEQRHLTGKKYIKARMRDVSVGWPHHHIEIKQDIWEYDCWTVRFNKKSAEHAVMFRMLLE